MSRLTSLRYRLGVWLLKPHWLPLLEHYNAIAEATDATPFATERSFEQRERAREQREHCAYIAIGIKYVVKASPRYGRMTFPSVRRPAGPDWRAPERGGYTPDADGPPPTDPPPRPIKPVRPH